MWICFTDSVQEPPPIQIGDDIIERVKTFKLLGVWGQDDLKWNEHIEQITRKANRRVFYLRQCMKSHLLTEVGLTTYTSKIRPILEYASPVSCGLPGYLQNEVEKVQRRSLRIIGLDSDFLPTLETRRNKASSREFRRICKYPEHPCQKLLPDKIMNPFELRRNPWEYQTSTSTELHKTHLYLVAENNSKFFDTVIMFVCFLLLSYLEPLYVILESIYDCKLFLTVI